MFHFHLLVFLFLISLILKIQLFYKTIHLFLSSASCMLSSMGLCSFISMLSTMFISSLKIVTIFQLNLALHSTYPHFQCFLTRFAMSRLLSSADEVIAKCDDFSCTSGGVTTKSCLLPTTSIGTFDMLLDSNICSRSVRMYWNESKFDKSNTNM